MALYPDDFISEQRYITAVLHPNSVIF